jgi:acyl-CoA dehydrogenase
MKPAATRLEKDRGATPYFAPDHDRFRATVRRFVESKVLPYADEWEREQCLPRWLWLELGQAGLLGLNHPPAYGGSLRDLFYSVVLLEELGRSGYAGFRAAVAVHAYMATYYLSKLGTPGLNAAYLAPAIAGEKVAALAISEPHAGSDLSRLCTEVTRDDAGYLVNGTKTFVTNGTTADYAVVAVKTKSNASIASLGATGLSLLIVDLEAPGVKRTPLTTLGWHSGGTAEIEFHDVRVASEHLIGKPDRGFLYLMNGFQLERLVAGALALGGIDKCMEAIRLHLLSRQAFGTPLAGRQALRHRIADLSTEVEAARHLIYHAAWCYQQGRTPIVECTMAKLKACELARRLGEECIHLHGSHGYRDDAVSARFYRDAPAAAVAGGVSEILRDIIAQAVFEENWTGSADARQ